MKTTKPILLLGFFLLCYCLPAMAQSISSLCPNTALAPVFKQDFGQGANSGSTSKAAAGSTNYNFGGVGTDGNYIITPLVNNANKSDWTKGGDHTGNTNGNMFLVNAGGGNSIFFKQNVTGLCTGSSFNFSAWIANVNTSKTQNICGSGLVYPKVIFNIRDLSGNILGTVTTGDLPLSPNNGPANWKKYGFQFSLPVGVTALTLEMVDFYGGDAACGNDLALDDIEFSACTPVATATLTTASMLCAGSSTSIRASLVNSPFITPAYQWQKSTDNGSSWTDIGTTNHSIDTLALKNLTIADGAMYRVLVGPDSASLHSATCITASNAITLIVNQNPAITLGNNGPLCAGTTLSFNSVVTGGLSPYVYGWTGPNAFSSVAPNPIIAASTISATGRYLLNVTDANGCKVTDSTSVTVNTNPVLTLSNHAQTVCSGSSYSVTFNSTVSGTTYTWQSFVRSGTITGNTNNNSGTVLNTLSDVLVNNSNTNAIISYVITATTAGGCVAVDSSQVTIVPQPTIAQAGADQFLCKAYSTVLNANIPVTGSGIWSQVSGPALVNFFNKSDFNSGLFGLTTGTYAFAWTISNGICTVSADTVSVTVFTDVSVANAGPDQTICLADSVTLNANTPVSGNGKWTLISGPTPVVFSDSGSATAKISGLNGGIYVLAWTISNGACADSKDTVQLTVLPLSGRANAGTDQAICTGNTTFLQANNPGSQTGVWKQISGPSVAVFADSSLYNTQVTGLITGSYQFVWTISTAGCGDTKDTVNISLVTTPPIANAGSDQILCFIDSARLAAQVPAAGSGKWSLLSGPSAVVFADSANANTTVKGLTAGIYQFIWTISNTTCPDSKDTVSISILPDVTKSFAGNDRTVCLIDSVSLNGNIPVIGVGKWSFVSGPSAVVFSDSFSSGTTVKGLIAGTYQFVWKISNSNCPDSKDTVSITVLPAVTIANAGVDQTICFTDSTSLNANLPVVGSGKWSLVSGPSTIVFTDSSKANAIVKGLMAGTYQFVWKISNSNCPDSKDTVSITVLPAVTIANAGVDQNLCFIDSATLNANTPVIGSGKWAFISGPSAVVFTDSSKTNTTIKGLMAGTYQLVWKISNNNCPDSKDTVNITVLPAVTIANAGIDQSICFTDSTSLNANLPVVGTGNWSLLSGPSVLAFADSSKANTTVKGMVAGTYQFVWKISNNNCPDSKDTVNITVLPAITIANAGVNQTICFTDSTSLNANLPVVGSGKWSLIAGPSAVVFTDSSKTNTTIKGLMAGTYQLVWNISNNNCPDSKDTVNITVLPAVTIANAGVDQTICFTDSTSLNANSPVVGTGKWSLLSGPSTVVFKDSSKANTTVKGLVAGTYQLVWKISNNNCPDSKDTVNITVLPAVTIANAGIDQTICFTDSTSLNANLPVVGTGKWSLLSGPSTVVFTDSSKANTITKGLMAGTYQLVWNISNNNCPDSKDTVNITVLPAVTIANAGIDQTLCFTDSATLNANTPVIGSAKWAFISGPSAVVFTDSSKANTTVKGLVAGTYQLVWNISNNNCPDSKDTVSITILPAVTIANAGVDQTLCFTDSATLNANIPVIGSGKWSLLSGPSVVVFTDSSKANTIAKGLMAGTYQFVWKISNSNCPDSKDTVNITILPAVTIANAGIDQTLCFTDSATLNANTPVIGSGKWSFISGPSAVVFTDSSKANTTVKGLVAGTYQLVWNISNNNCPDSKDTVSITILPAVTIANAGIDQTLCFTDSATLNANTPVIGSGKWSFISGPSVVVFTDSSKANTIVKGLMAGTYQLVWKISGNLCPGTNDTLNILIYPAITNLIDTVKKRVCAGQLVTINGQPATGGNGISTYQWEKSYDGINWQTIPGANGSNYIYTADTSIWLKRKLENNVCPNYSLPVFIRADKALSGNQISKDQEICYGDSAQAITGTIPAGGDGDYLYRWEKSIDSGKTWIIIDSAIQKDFRPRLVPVKTIFRRVVTTDDCQGAISINSNTVSILVRPLPKAELQIATRISCAPFHLDSTTVKNITYPDRNGRYEWYINNTLSGNATGFPGFILQADSAIIKLKVFSLYGCASDSAGTTVSVYPIPHPAFTISDTAGCGPLDIHFTNTTPSNPLFQYKWDMGNGQIIQNADPGTVHYPSSVSRLDTFYTVRLQVFTVCDTVTITKQIRVRTRPAAEMNLKVLNTCSPMNVLFHTKSSGENSSYRIYFGDGTDSSIQPIADFIHTYHTGNPASFPAKLVAKNECGVDSVVIPLTALPNPVSVKMILKDTAVCGAPYTMVLNNQTTASQEFRWDWGDGSANLVTNLSGSVSHLYQQPGNYMISSTVSSGCSDSVVYRPLYIYPSVKAIAANILQNACIGEAISFRSLSDSSLSSEWNFGNGIFSNTVADTYRYSSPGVYTPSLKVWSVHPQVSCYDSTKQTIEIIAERKGKFSVSDTIITCSPFRVKVKNLSTIPLQTEWNWGDGTTSYSDTASHQYLRNGTYLILMHAVADGGCIYADSVFVTIQIPELQLQFKAGTYCTLNNPIVFTPSVSNTDSIRWNFGDGTIITAVPGKISHIYTSPGMYVPKLELLNTLSSCILPASASDTIRIDEIKADYTLSAIYDCGVTSYRFTDSSQSYFPIDQRIWTLDQVQVSREKIHTQSFTRTGSHTSGLQVKTVYGCIADLQSKFSTTIYQYPAVNINAISQACLNNLMEMKSVVNSIDSVKSIYWNLGNGNNAIDSVVKVFYTVEGKYTVKLTVSTINSCYDSAYKIITIHPEPKITIAGDQILCKGDSLQLKANGAMKYIWKDQNDQIICSDCVTASVKPIKNTHYKVIGYSEYGCSQIGSTNVRVIQPLKMIVKTPDSMCIGDTKKLLAAGAAQYNWLPDPTISNRTSPTPYVSPVTNTVYKVVGKDAYQCFNDTAEVKIIVGKPTPIAIGRDTVILSGTPVQLHAVSSLQDIRKWQWAGNATFSCLTCPSPVAKVIFDECLSCTATNIYGCVSSDTVCIKTFCPTSEVFIPNAFSPDGDGINDLLIVQGRGLKLVKSFRVFNRWGEVVFEKTNFLPGDVSSGWDGKVRSKPASPDVYVYVCEVVCERGLPATFKGNVAILK